MLKRLAYAWYAKRLKAQLAGGPLPGHVAMVMDGNRRWARQVGYDNPSTGHRYGAAHVEAVLGWCLDAGVRHATIFVASSDNLRKRDSGEISFLLELVEEVILDRLNRTGGAWRLRVAGRLDDLPDSTRHALKLAVENSVAGDRPGELTIAIGYDGREELVDAVRGLLGDAADTGESCAELAQRVTADDIAGYLYTSGLPDPDLVIRTSGERRLSGFLLWQAAYSELYFCDVYWPGFREVDFLRALRAYAGRQRRFGA